MGIETIDISILVIYTLIILGVGLYLGKREDAADFFVNSGKTKFWLLLFTTLSTSVGAGSMIGVISATKTSGISYATSFIFVSVIGWMLMAYLAPRIKRIANETGAYTFGDIIANKLSNRARLANSLVVLSVYMIFVAIQYIAIAHIIELVFRLNYNWAMILSALVTISYTSLSGIKGDIYTDAIQFFVMFPVFIFVIWKGLSIVGLNNLFADNPDNFLNVYNFAGPVFFYAAILFGFSLLVGAMDIWQRVFIASDEKTATRAFIWTGILKVGFIIASVIIGFLAVKLVPEANPDSAIFDLMYKILPSGMLGLGLASVMSIVMSTVDSGIVVGSATITKDLYVRSREVSDEKILLVGRLSAVGFGLASLIIAFLAPNIPALSVASTQIAFVLLPTLLALLFNIKIKESTAFWSIIWGYITIVITLFFTVNYAFIPGLIVTLSVFFGLHFYNREKELLIN